MSDRATPEAAAKAYEKSCGVLGNEHSDIALLEGDEHQAAAQIAEQPA